MQETFVETCRILNSKKEPAKPSTESPYSIEEALFLLLTRNLTENTTETKKHTNAISERRKRSEQLKRLCDYYNLETPVASQKPVVECKKPSLFSGTLKINGKSISIHTRSSEIELSIIKKTFRYCANPPDERFKVSLATLGGFGKIESNSQYTIEYTRSTDNIEEILATCACDRKIETLLYMGVSVEKLVKNRIELFVKRAIKSSLTIMHDLSFISIHEKVILNLTDLVIYLEDSISSCSCDLHAHDLFKLVGFLVMTGRASLDFKVPVSSPEITMNKIKRDKNVIPALIQDTGTVISKGTEIPTGMFRRFAAKIREKITGTLLRKREGDKYLVDVYQMLRNYKILGVLLRSETIARIVAECYENRNSIVFSFIVVNFFPNLSIDPELDQKIVRKKHLERIWDLFCSSLNACLKGGFDLDVLYWSLMSVNLSDSFLTPMFFDKVSTVHLKRIKKSRNAEELKRIHQSMVRMEKFLGFRSLKVESELKECVLRLMKQEKS